MIAVCVAAIGCKDGGTTIWSADVRSPDKNWIASANTQQWSGPGTAYVATSVYLKRPDNSKPPIEILEFANDSAYPSGITNVEMNWLTPSHLEVAYKGHPSLNFQAIKCAGVDISIRSLPTEALDTPVNP
jgi:hypothetical protein